MAVVDRTANISHAAAALGSSRTLFKGRSSYAPDVVLVNEFVADDFIHQLVQAITSPTSRETPGFAQNSSKAPPDKHSSIIKELEGNEGCRIVMSGANGSIIEVRDR